MKGRVTKYVVDEIKKKEKKKIPLLCIAGMEILQGWRYCRGGGTVGVEDTARLEAGTVYFI